MIGSITGMTTHIYSRVTLSFNRQYSVQYYHSKFDIIMKLYVENST